MPIALLKVLKRTFSTTTSVKRDDQLMCSRLKPDIDVQPLDLKKYKPGSVIAKGPDEVKAKILELVPHGRAILMTRIYHTHHCYPHYYTKINDDIFDWDQGSDRWIKVEFEKFARLKVGYRNEQIYFLNSWIGSN